MDKLRKEEIRIAFFREHRNEIGFSSVCVRDRGDQTYLDVELTKRVDFVSAYEGLPVRTTVTAPFVNAVLPISDRP
jgi:hypothetical protein